MHSSRLALKISMFIDLQQQWMECWKARRNDEVSVSRRPIIIEPLIAPLIILIEKESMKIVDATMDMIPKDWEKWVTAKDKPKIKKFLFVPGHSTITAKAGLLSAVYTPLVWARHGVLSWRPYRIGRIGT